MLWTGPEGARIGLPPGPHLVMTTDFGGCGEKVTPKINTADRYDIPDKADLDVLRTLHNAAAIGMPICGANCTISGQEREIHVETDLKCKADKGWSSIAPGRIELPTSGLGNRCSIRLSYGAVAAV